MNENTKLIKQILQEVKKAKGYGKAFKLLELDPAFKNVFGYNELLHEPVFLNNLPFRSCDTSKYNGESWKDIYTTELMKYCLTRYNLSISRNYFEEAIQMISLDDKFHPIQKYLKSLPIWDRIPRIATLFIDYLGVEDNAYTRELGQIFMLALVKRAFEAGCKFDLMPILQGEGGVGKSSFFRIIGGEWFSDSISTFTGREAIEQMEGVWLAEIAELQAFIKADITDPKSFLTRQTDKTRKVYRRNTEEFQRITVFGASTNEKEYVRDITSGKRRYCPLDCTKELDQDLLKTNRDQLFAEAYYCYLNEPENLLVKKLNFATLEAERLAKEAREKAEEIDPWLEILTAYLEDKEEVFTADLCRCLNISSDKINSKHTRKISVIMHKLGWCSFKNSKGVRGYRKPE